MPINVTVVADSIYNDSRITTLSLVYPRFIHSELMTHRVFSRNAMSSRAVPVAKMIEQVRNDPVVPWHWGSNKPGMQAGAEIDEGDKLLAIDYWKRAAIQAAGYAQTLNELGLHKQICNRLLEPFQWMKTIVTATDPYWQPFFELRVHEMAEPHFYDLARAMQVARAASTPVRRFYHLPYIDQEQINISAGVLDELFMISAARCARVSYDNHDGSKADPVKDIKLAEMLRDSRHASPFEHCATAFVGHYANFKGWQSFRNQLGL